MKLKIVLICMLCKTFLLADFKVETQILDQIFSSINKKRYGLKRETIQNTKNPFMVQKDIEENSEKKEKKEPYVLQAVLNNRALINGKWISLNQTIGNHKLVKIAHDNATLDSGGVEKKLYIQGDKNVNISIK